MKKLFKMICRVFDGSGHDSSSHNILNGKAYKPESGGKANALDVSQLYPDKFIVRTGAAFLIQNADAASLLGASRQDFQHQACGNCFGLLHEEFFPDEFRSWKIFGQIRSDDTEEALFGCCDYRLFSGGNLYCCPETGPFFSCCAGAQELCCEPAGIPEGKT